MLSNNFIIKEIKDWKAFLAGEDDERDKKLFKKHARVGRPLGEEGFIEKIEKTAGRGLEAAEAGEKRTN